MRVAARVTRLLALALVFTAALLLLSLLGNWRSSSTTHAYSGSDTTFMGMADDGRGYLLELPDPGGGMTKLGELRLTAIDTDEGPTASLATWQVTTATGTIIADDNPNPAVLVNTAKVSMSGILGGEAEDLRSEAGDLTLPRIFPPGVGPGDDDGSDWWLLAIAGAGAMALVGAVALRRASR